MEYEKCPLVRADRTSAQIAHSLAPPAVGKAAPTRRWRERRVGRLAFLTIALAAVAALATGWEANAVTLRDVVVAVERWHAGVARKDITLADGTHIVYLEGGSGKPLILLHGFGADKDSFTLVSRWLTPYYRVIAPDLPGFGESTHRLDSDYHYAAQARRLHDFVQAVAPGHADLAGSSMGGGIAMTYAALYPAQVDSLWLLDAAGIVEAPPSQLAKIIATTGHNPLILERQGDFAQLMRFTMSNPPYLPQAVTRVLARERIANQVLERKAFQQIATDSISGMIRGLPTPTLIVWGAEDRALSVDTVPILRSLLPNSTAVVMPHVGHLPMIEQPQQAAQDYLRFRKRIADAPAA